MTMDPGDERSPPDEVPHESRSGPGCAKCRESSETARTFFDARGIAADIVKIESIQEMTNRGVLRTPTTMIDGSPVVQGRVLREKDLEAWLARHDA